MKIAPGIHRIGDKIASWSGRLSNRPATRLSRTRVVILRRDFLCQSEFCATPWLPQGSCVVRRAERGLCCRYLSSRLAIDHVEPRLRERLGAHAAADDGPFQKVGPRVVPKDV